VFSDNRLVIDQVAQVKFGLRPNFGSNFGLSGSFWSWTLIEDRGLTALYIWH